MNDFISIIIPAYNLENYIENTIHNVLSQEYCNFEIVIVNDGSKDKTGEILDRLAALHPDKLRVIHIPNGGVTNARLTGVRAAKGDWIAFVDGDDLIDPTIYTTLLRNAQEKNADISHCGYSMVFPSRSVPYHGTGQQLTHNTEEALVQLLSATLIEPALWNKLYKKELFAILLDSNLMDRSIKINEDLLMNYYLFREAKRSVFEDLCLYHYMVHSGSAANSPINEHLLLDPCRVRKIIMEHCIDLPSIYPLACENYIRQLITLSTRSVKVSPSLIRPHQKQARKDLRNALRAQLPSRRSVRLMGIWAAYLPSSYRWVHSAYSKMRGYDKLYEIK